MEHVSPLATSPRVNNVLDLISEPNSRLAVLELLQTALTDVDRDEMIEKMVEREVYEVYLREKLASVVQEDDFLSFFSPAIRQLIKPKLDAGLFERAEAFLSTNSEAYRLYEQWRAVNRDLCTTAAPQTNASQSSSSYSRTETRHSSSSHRKYNSVEVEQPNSRVNEFKQLNRISEEEETRSRSQTRTEIELERLQKEMSRVMQKFRRDFASLPTDLTSCDQDARQVLLEFVESFQPLVREFKERIEDYQGGRNFSKELEEWQKAADLLCAMPRDTKATDWNSKKTSSRSEKSTFESWNCISPARWGSQTLPPQKPPLSDWIDQPIFMSSRLGQPRMYSTFPRRATARPGHQPVVREIPIQRPLSTNLSSSARPAPRSGAAKRPTSVTFGEVRLDNDSPRGIPPRNGLSGPSNW